MVSNKRLRLAFQKDNHIEPQISIFFQVINYLLFGRSLQVLGTKAIAQAYVTGLDQYLLQKCECRGSCVILKGS